MNGGTYPPTWVSIRVKLWAWTSFVCRQEPSYGSPGAASSPRRMKQRAYMGDKAINCLEINPKTVKAVIFKKDLQRISVPANTSKPVVLPPMRHTRTEREKVLLAGIALAQRTRAGFSFKG